MQPMKPERKHLSAGTRRESGSKRADFLMGSALAGVGIAVTAAAVVVGSGLAIPAGIASVAAAAFAGSKFRELKTWDEPEITLATAGANGTMLAFTEGQRLGLGTTIVGNYRRRPHVQPIPHAELRGSLVAEEKTKRGGGKNAKRYSGPVVEVPLTVQENVNDGLLDVDFTVQIPVYNAPVTMRMGDNEVKWYLQLHLSTKGADDRENIPIEVTGEINAAYLSTEQP